MTDLQTREQMLAGIVKPADILDLLRKVDHVQYKTGWQSKHLAADAIREITRLRVALSEAERRARREALEEAAKLAETFRRKQIGRDLSKATPDPCGRWDGGEIYEEGKEKHLIASRIRALIPTEPHDAEGRE